MNKELEYKLIELNSNLNGYPDSRVQDGTADHVMLGFGSFDEAVEFAREYGSEVIEVSIRAGSSFAYNEGTAYRAFSYQDYLNKLGENYMIYNENEFLDLVKEQVNDINKIEQLNDIMIWIDEILKETNKLNDDEVLILRQGYPYETVPSTMMSFTEDGTKYAIGVLIPNEIS